MQLDKIQCISFQTVTSRKVGFKGKKKQQMEGNLTLMWHNQGELLNHGCQQLHHGLYVFSAEREITKGQVK